MKRSTTWPIQWAHSVLCVSLWRPLFASRVKRRCGSGWNTFLAGLAVCVFVVFLVFGTIGFPEAALRQSSESHKLGTSQTHSKTVGKNCGKLAVCVTGGFRGGDECIKSQFDAILAPNRHWKVDFFLATWIDRQCYGKDLQVTEQYLRNLYNGNNVSFLYIGDSSKFGGPEWVYRSHGYREGTFPYPWSKPMWEGTFRMTKLWEVCLAAVPDTYDIIVRYRHEVCFPVGWQLQFNCPRSDSKVARRSGIECWDTVRDDGGVPATAYGLDTDLVYLELPVKESRGLAECKAECNRNPACNSITFCPRKRATDTCTLYASELSGPNKQIFMIQHMQSDDGWECTTHFATNCSTKNSMRSGPEIQHSRNLFHFSVSKQNNTYVSTLDDATVHLFESRFHRELKGGVAGTIPDDSMAWGLTAPMKTVYGTLRAMADAGRYDISDAEYVRRWGDIVAETGHDKVDEPKALLNPRGHWVRERYPEKLLKHHILNRGQKYRFVNSEDLAVYGHWMYHRNC